MRKSLQQHLDFEVDKLTKSIENVASGDSFQTELSPVSVADFKIISRKNGWLFNWKNDFKQLEREVYKLTITGNPFVIQGAISIEPRPQHVYIHLLKSAPFNRGSSKVYAGVPGNLVAYACKRSFLLGFDGYVAFQSKTRLIDHYVKTLGARHLGKHTLVIETDPALKLVNQYFKS